MKRIIYAVATLAFGAGLCLAGNSCDEALQKLDTNKDQSLSFEEFSVSEFYVLEHEQKLPLFSVKDLDTNGDGSITAEELKRGFFNKVDKNKDGKIDKKEWEEYFTLRERQISTPR